MLFGLLSIVLSLSTAGEILPPSRTLPSKIAAALDRPHACVEISTGELLVLDAGAHALSVIDANRTTVRRLLQPGPEWGRILRPNALALGRDGTVAVADLPATHDRIQLFSLTGALLGRFFPPGASGTRLTIGPLVMNGIGAMQFTGKTFLITAPYTGALMMELNRDGLPIRSIGTLRRTGHEADRTLHLALNAGLPLIDPNGGFYFVFQTGTPMFQKFDASGALVFERHVEGSELDATLRSLPNTWPARDEYAGLLPYAPPTVSAAAVDPAGRLWISLTVGSTYVYDSSGEKIRVFQFRTDRTLTPSHLYFPDASRILTTPGCEEFRVPGDLR